MGHMCARVGVEQGWGRGGEKSIMIFKNNMLWYAVYAVEFHYVTIFL